MKHILAKAIADQLVEQLRPHCERIEIAGSVRRLVDEVTDIELVLIPKTEPSGAFGLFDAAPESNSVIPAYADAIKKLGRIGKGKFNGRQMQVNLIQGISLDIFTPEPYDFIRMFAIRTGSTEYAVRAIASAWKAIGWCGTPMGLRKIVDCEETSSGWKCVNPNAELPPVWKDEREFFAWLRQPYIPPNQRIR